MLLWIYNLVLSLNSYMKMTENVVTQYGQYMVFLCQCISLSSKIFLYLDRGVLILHVDCACSFLSIWVFSYVE